MTGDAFWVDLETDVEPGQSLVVGLSHIGMAGLTAADYLVRHLRANEIGHITTEELPSITPFENGTPRHATRLYNLVDADLTVLVNDLFVPVWAARSFATALLEWIETVRVDEITILHGVPFPHGPERHTVMYVADEAYQERRLADTSFEPLRGGFLDGVAGELAARSLTGDAPPVGVLVTPTHPPGPDIDAGMLFLDAVEHLYDLTVDRQELLQLSDEIKLYFANLADRVASLDESDQALASRDFPEDRMYM